MDDEDQNMADMDALMLSGFNRQEGLIRGHPKAPLSDVKFQSLSGDTVYDRLLSWGTAASADADTIELCERENGILRLCPDCEDDGCRGGLACVACVDTLMSPWTALFSSLKCERKARKKLIRFLAANDCSSLPSSAKELRCPRLTAEGAWEVFLDKLTDLWGRMGDESERRLWLARFYCHWRQPKAEAGDTRLARLQSAWVGFALQSTVQLGPTLVSCQSRGTPSVVLIDGI
jgi:hypothetical protein